MPSRSSRIAGPAAAVVVEPEVAQRLPDVGERLAAGDDARARRPGASTSTALIGLAARNARTIAQRGPYICASASSEPGGTSIGNCR